MAELVKTPRWNRLQRLKHIYNHHLDLARDCNDRHWSEMHLWLAQIVDNEVEEIRAAQANQLALPRV